MMRGVRIAVVLSVVFSRPAVTAQEGRYSLLSPAGSGSNMELLESADRPTLDPGAVVLLEPTSLEFPPPRTVARGKPADRGPGGLNYRLGDSLSAGLTYRHALLFETGTGESLRQHQFGDFATDRDRDVLKLNMSWDLALTRLDLGYRIDSTRVEPGQEGYSLLGVLPESDHRTHSLTLGVTRRWGGAR